MMKGKECISKKLRMMMNPGSLMMALLVEIAYQDDDVEPDDGAQCVTGRLKVHHLWAVQSALPISVKVTTCFGPKLPVVGAKRRWVFDS